MRKDHSKDAIIQHSIEFSLMVIKYAEQLEADKKHVIANQVLKSGTAIGAHVMAGRSTDDKEMIFEKMKLADNAAHKTWYWFYLCEMSQGYGFPKELSVKLDKIMQELHTIIIEGTKK